MSKPKYENVTVELIGFDGNAYSILGKTVKALRREGVPKEEIDQYLTEAKSGDYDNLLRVTMEWVEVL